MQLARQLIEADCHVDADAEHRPPILRAVFGEYPRQLQEA
jgi:hypothetical protein